MEIIKRPGGAMANRPLHFFWLADCSGSMYGEKIEQLNYAIRNAIKPMQDVAADNPNAQVMIRAIKFSTGADWHIAQTTPVEEFKWDNLTANGVTDMGLALQLVAEQLDVSQMPERCLPPVLVLVSDGQPTDDFTAGLNALMSKPWGRKSVRIGIGIGQDADLDVLQKFIGNPEIKPLQANNAEDLVKYIRWASTVVLQAASAPASQVKDQASSGGIVPIPQAPAASDIDDDDVW
jgi:uncharacterized protein YegL